MMTSLNLVMAESLNDCKTSVGDIIFFLSTRFDMNLFQKKNTVHFLFIILDLRLIHNRCDIYLCDQYIY